MKIARVIPLFKTGNTKEFYNYRHSSSLPQFSKILEKMYHFRLMAFIDNNQILYKIQKTNRQLRMNWVYLHLKKNQKANFSLSSLLTRSIYNTY